MNSHAGAVLDQLDRLFNRGTVTGLGEGALLERYVADGDEAAFAALVARHGPMVLGVCRRVLRDERDVEDAFQATFLVLVRRAGAIRDGDLVGRWLHGVAHRVAVRARAHSARRFVHEQSVSEPIEALERGPASSEAERRELAAIVDEEVTRLPSPLRAPVVLCYLESLNQKLEHERARLPVEALKLDMLHDEKQIKELEAKIIALRERLARSRKYLDDLGRDKQPAPAQPAAATPTPSPPVEKGKEDGDWDLPRYAYLSRSAKIMVVSPDGARIANYDPASGESAPLELPAIRGVRRELIVMDTNPFVLGSRKAGVEIDKLDGYMFLALDLDRDGKVTRIGAFHATQGNWIGQVLPEPVDRSSVKMLGGASVLGIGRRIYILTFPAKHWAVLESPPGKAARLFLQENMQWAECDGRLFRLNDSTGVWDDIYARALEDKPLKSSR